MRKLASVLVSIAALCALTVGARAAEGGGGEGFLSEIGGAKFLAGQFFTILASVVGVYFASYVSFQRSLKHSKLVKAQQRSALLTGSREELNQNIARMRKLDERLPLSSAPGFRAVTGPICACSFGRPWGVPLPPSICRRRY